MLVDTEYAVFHVTLSLASPQVYGLPLQRAKVECVQCDSHPERPQSGTGGGIRLADGEGKRAVLFSHPFMGGCHFVHGHEGGQLAKPRSYCMSGSGQYGGFKVLCVVVQMITNKLSEQATREALNPYPVYCAIDKHSFQEGHVEGALTPSQRLKKKMTPQVSM